MATSQTVQSIPPRIPDNSNYDNNYSGSLETQSIYSKTSTDGTSVLTLGRLSGLSNPVDTQDAAPKSYITGSRPNGPASTVQFNNLGVFSGSANLKFIGNLTQGSLMLGTGTTLTDSILSMNGTYIYGLVEPKNDTDICTKHYCDYLRSTNNVQSITSPLGTTYSAASLINGTIIRTEATAGSLNVTDYMPSSEEIIAQLQTYGSISTSQGSIATAGLSYKFKLINNGTGNVTINNGTGITIGPGPLGPSGPIIVYPSYVMSATIIVDQVSPALITLNVDVNNWSVIYVQNLLVGNGFTSFLPYIVTNNLLAPGPASYTTETAGDYLYAAAQVHLGIITRNPPGPGPSTDVFDNLMFSGSFVIQNISAVNITLNSIGSNGTWVFYPAGPITIGPSKSAFMQFSWVSGVNYLNMIGVSDI